MRITRVNEIESSLDRIDGVVVNITDTQRTKLQRARIRRLDSEAKAVGLPTYTDLVETLRQITGVTESADVAGLAIVPLDFIPDAK